MASIHSEKKHGKIYYRLCVVVNGQRQRFGLGYDFANDAVTSLERIASKLESLKMTNEKLLDRKIIKEVSSLDQSIVDWFVSVGLLDAPTPRLKEFVEDYISTKHGIEDYTIYKLQKSAKFLAGFFKHNPRVTEICRADVENYINHKRKLGKAEDTIRSEVKHGRQFFDYAKKKLLVDDNPFEGHKFHKTDLSARKVVIPSDDLQKAINAATCMNWRCYLAILRWTGCRKSEGFKVKWTDVDFAKKTIRITSDKTKKAGKGFREIPLFPELEKILADAWSVSDKATEYVVNGDIRPSKDKQGRVTINLDKPFRKILQAANVKPWVKLFQNIRVTRENELIRENYAAHVVHAWMGHTKDVADANYLTVMESDFQKAVGGPLVVSKDSQPIAPTSKRQATIASTLDLQEEAIGCGCGLGYKVPPQGDEPRTR